MAKIICSNCKRDNDSEDNCCIYCGVKFSKTPTSIPTPVIPLEVSTIDLPEGLRPATEMDLVKRNK